MDGHYNNVDNSPTSDRLVIDNSLSSPCNTSQTESRIQSAGNPIQHSHTFSMDSLLSGYNSEQPVITVPEALHPVPSEQGTLPSICEAFLHYSGTTLSDTVNRIFDIVNPDQLNIPPYHVQMVQPAVLTHKVNTSNSHTTTTKTAQEPSLAKRKKPSAKDPGTIMKPPYTYVGLIIMAIDSSTDKMLTLAGVRDKLKTWFPFFSGPYTGWKESIRHSLSSHQCFYKVKLDDRSRNYYWAVNYQNVKLPLLVRQNKSNMAEYKYYLHEQLGLPPVKYPVGNKSIPSHKHADLTLPSKPSYEPTESSPNAEFLCTRNDDVILVSVSGESSSDTLRLPVTTSTNQYSQPQKRKAETPATDLSIQPKRRKTAAVNPTLSTNHTSVSEPSQKNLNQSSSSTPFTANHSTIQHSTSPSEYYNHYGHYQNGSQYPSGLHNYQSYQWQVYNSETSNYNQSTPSNYYSCYPGYGNLTNQHQYIMTPWYSSWTYPTNYVSTEGPCYDPYSGYWQRQTTDPSGVSLDLFTNLDKPT